jgi:tetratricopeptide (TPR) repeat protein
MNGAPGAPVSRCRIQRGPKGNQVWYTISTYPPVFGLVSANPLDRRLSATHTPKRAGHRLLHHADRDPVTRYSRQDVLRILHLQARQLTAWEREGLIPAVADGEHYSFEHLSRLRALRELRSKRISARSLKAQVEAMQRVSGMRNALVETSAVRQGSRLTFRHAGALVDPLTRQLAFDFATVEGRRLKVVRSGGRTASPPTPGAAEVQEMFIRAVQLEESTSTLSEAVLTYEAILELRPDHAPACINLGTIRYNQREFLQAEHLYRRATEADPEYALAFFDLGNVLDEMQRLDDAIEAYQRAIKLVPQYADAHYNVALAYERQGERRRALRHWVAYVRLDPVGPWAAHAKGQMRKILALERLSIVSRGGLRVSAAG